MGHYTIKMPDIGEGISEAEIVAWHVAVGSRVEEDGRLADMMTDKATVEMESPVAGVVVVNPGLTIADPRARYAGVLKYVMRSVPAIANNIKKEGLDEGAYARTPVAAVGTAEQRAALLGPLAEGASVLAFAPFTWRKSSPPPRNTRGPQSPRPTLRRRCSNDFLPRHHSSARS